MGGAPQETIEDQVFNLKFSAKSLRRESDKARKEEEKARQDAANALKQNLRDNATAYAQLSIAKHNQSIQLAKLSAKLDVIASQLQMQVKTQGITGDIGRLNVSLQQAIQQMNVEKVSQIMDEFEQNNQQLQLNSDLMNQVMDQQQNSVAAPIATQDLLAQIADEQEITLGKGYEDIQARCVERKKENEDAQ